MLPQPHIRNARRLSHAHGLASSAFARHYSRNHNCFLFLRVLRCFTSPRSPLHPMYSALGDTTSLVPGFPIRTSSDPRSVDSSPRHNAASHVLHRLPVPRHPPCALKHLQHKTVKKFSEESKNCIIYTHKNTNPHKEAGAHACKMLATTIHKSNTTPHHQSRATTTNPHVESRPQTEG